VISTAQKAAVPAPVHGNDEGFRGGLVGGTAPGTRLGPLSRAYPNVFLIEVLPAIFQEGRPVSSAHSAGKFGNVLPTVATLRTSIPGTARPRTAAAMTIRWSL